MDSKDITFLSNQEVSLQRSLIQVSHLLSIQK